MIDLALLAIVMILPVLASAMILALLAAPGGGPADGGRAPGDAPTI